jgi:hypothetical protein
MGGKKQLRIEDYKDVWKKYVACPENNMETREARMKVVCTSVLGTTFPLQLG